MNIDDTLDALRSAVTPEDDVVARHRAELLATIAQSRTDDTGVGLRRVELDTTAAPSRRSRWLAPVAAAIAMIGFAGAVLIADRSDRSVGSDAIDGGATVASGSEAVPVNTTVSAPDQPATSVSVAPAPVERVERVEPTAFADLVGPVNFEFHDAVLDVPLGEASDWRWTMTDTGLCNQIVGADEQPADCTVPRGLTMWGRWTSRGTAPGSFHELRAVTPVGIELQLLTDTGDPAPCRLEATSAPTIGPIVLWSCEAEGPPTMWDLQATIDGLSFITDVVNPDALIPGAPLPNIGDQVAATKPGWPFHWVGSAATASAVVAVERDGRVIGYTQIGVPADPTGYIDGAIIDAKGVVIGQFVDSGVPVLHADGPPDAMYTDEAAERMPSHGFVELKPTAPIDVGTIEGRRVVIEPPFPTMADAVACLAIYDTDDSAGRWCPTEEAARGLLSGASGRSDGTGELVWILTADSVTATAEACDLQPITLTDNLPAIFWWCNSPTTTGSIDYVLPDGSTLRVG